MTLRPFLAALLAAACTLVGADESAAWAALRKDGAVALVRHGEAPGVGDPQHWKLGDCNTQRNLDDAGRAQARALGARLKAERIQVARLLASPWCRTLETATLLGVGTVQPEPTFSNAFVLSERRGELSAGARAPVVPDLVGSSERAAIIRLQGDGLNLTRTVEIRSADYPADTVIGQWPPAKVKAADVVLLVNRSERGATYVMPDVIGLDGTKAADLLRGWGFRASVVGTYPYPGIAPNIVLRQSPPAGERVSSRAALSLDVSRPAS